MSMMGELKFFLGLQVHQSPRGIFISQSQYAIELLKKHGLDECVSMSTPMATERLDADLQGTPTDQTTYRRMIGGLMYLIASRPDIAFATFDYGFELIAYSDADHAGCKDDCKKAEYVSLSACCAQVIWMRTQLLDYGFKYNRIPMYCDSKSAIAISCNPVQHSKTKHIDIRYHFIKEHVERGTVEIYFVGTEYQLADLFTKALPKERFEYLVHRIGMRCMTPTQLESLTKLSSWHNDNMQLMFIQMNCVLQTSDMTLWMQTRRLTLWHTLTEDGSKHRLKFLLDRKELILTLDDFRTIFHLPQVNDNNHASFVPPPSFSNMVPFYKQVLGFTMELKTKKKNKVGMRIPTWMITEEIKLTEHYKMYAKVFRLDVPLTRSQPTESTQGTHRTLSAPRPPNPATETAESMPTAKKANEMILQDMIQVSVDEHKSREEQEARENVALVYEHLAAEEIEKLVEESKNVDDSSPPRHDDTSIPGTRLEPRSDKESMEEEIVQEKEEETTKDTKVEPDIVIPINVDDEEDKITDEVFELRRRAKGKNVEESRISPIPSPTRSPRNLSTLVSSDTEKLQELTVTHPTPSSGSFAPKLTKTNRLLSLIKAKPNRFKRYKSFFHELQGRYGYLFAHLKKRFMPRTSSDQLADNLHDVMMETLPSLVKEKVTEQVKKEVPAQVRDQVPVYLAEGLILERKTTKEETERLISKAILQERGRMQAQISSQIQNAIDNAIPSLVNAFVRQLLPDSLFFMFIGTSSIILVQNKQLQLYLDMKDQDDPHADAILRVESIVQKGRRTSEYEAYVSDPEAPALSLINQDLLYLKKGNSGPEKIVLSLHKFPTIVFNDDDIEERTSRWVNKCIKKFNPYARYVFIRSSVIWERVHDFQLGIESYQQKINLTAPTITFLGIEEYDVFSIVYEPVHGIIYTNSKKEKRVMRHSEIHKFCNATLRRTLEGLKSYNNDVKKLTNERLTEMDIRLSLASHSYMYPLGILEDILVDVAGYVYPIDFVILDIKEDEKRPFILGTSFLTTAKAVIKFDKGIVTLRYGKSKMSFHRIPESLCKIEKGIKNDIEPITPTMTVNRLFLKWEERIKLHQEKEMEFDQWRTKTVKPKNLSFISYWYF
ncbi:retrovirus-related pol polyprotein from transposon TNT 1-94 [Tanacetum coccineum]